jgi:hypothetical protein
MLPRAAARWRVPGEVSARDAARTRARTHAHAHTGAMLHTFAAGFTRSPAAVRAAAMDLCCARRWLRRERGGAAVTAVTLSKAYLREKTRLVGTPAPEPPKAPAAGERFARELSAMATRRAGARRAAACARDARRVR